MLTDTYPSSKRTGRLPTVHTFKNRLDKHWADMAGIWSRSAHQRQVQARKTNKPPNLNSFQGSFFQHNYESLLLVSLMQCAQMIGRFRRYSFFGHRHNEFPVHPKRCFNHKTANWSQNMNIAVLQRIVKCTRACCLLSLFTLFYLDYAAIRSVISVYLFTYVVLRFYSELRFKRDR